MKKPTILTEKLESLFNKILLSRNKTRWNSQIKMVRQVLQVVVNDIVKKKELQLTFLKKNILQDFVEFFERFEDATDILRRISFQLA